MQLIAWVCIAAGAICLVMYPMPAVALLATGAVVGALGKGGRR